MKFFHKKTLLLILAFLLPYQTAPAKPKPEYKTIEILFDAWGIPNVFSETDAGAFYGLGYASAQQRGFQMIYNLRILQGRAAEIIGDSTRENGKESILQQDKKMRIMGFYSAAQKRIPSLDAETRSFLQAYAEGVNDFFKENPDKINPLFKQLNITIDPWTPADCIASWWHLGQFFASDGLDDLKEYHLRKEPVIKEPAEPVKSRSRKSEVRIQPTPVQEKNPIDESAAIIKREDVADDWLVLVHNFLKQNDASQNQLERKTDSPKANLTWAIGKNKSKTGASVLCSDSQIPVQNPSQVYEFHISGQTFNARGIGVPGSPILFTGWTPTTAWGIAALGADQSDLFLLQNNEANPDQYLYNQEWIDCSTREETFLIKDATPETITIRETAHGPIVNDLLSEALPGEQIALKRIPLCDKDKETIQASIAMMRSQDVYQFSKVLDAWRFPAANMVFADNMGNIAYWVIGAIPIRSRLLKSNGAAAELVYITQQDWRGFYPSVFLPHVINPARNYIASTNQRPIQSFYPVDLGLSSGANGDNSRSWRLRERLEKKETFSPEEILDIHYDDVNPVKRDLLRIAYHQRDIQAKQFSTETKQALEYLESWYRNGSKSNLNNPGNELASLIRPLFQPGFTELTHQYGTGISGLSNFLKTARSIMLQNPNFTFDNKVFDFIDSVLSSAWSSAIQLYGDNPREWSHKIYELQGKNKISYYGGLDSFTSLDTSKDIPVPILEDVDNGTIHSQPTQSYTQWVSLSEADNAMSLMPLGPDENLASPYQKHSIEMWVKGELHPAPITRASVEKFSSRIIKLSK